MDIGTLGFYGEAGDWQPALWAAGDASAALMIVARDGRWVTLTECILDNGSWLPEIVPFSGLDKINAELDQDVPDPESEDA